MNDNISPRDRPWPLGHQQNDQKGQREAGERSKEGKPSHLQSKGNMVKHGETW